MLEEIKNAAAYINKIISGSPDTCIILGSGLGNLTSKIDILNSISYSDIPHFPISTVKGHKGNLIYGLLGGKEVLAFQGRFHYYEGYPMEQVVFPIRILKFLGIKNVILSNAAGGVNPSFSVGDVMVITDHINLFAENPLRGKNYDELGPRFPDMSEPYDKNLIALAKSQANELKIKTQSGIYLGTSGPTYETPAEYRFMKAIGADAVGMSTVPEVIIAKHMGMRCFALSVITDMGGSDDVEEVSHDIVLHVANEVEPKLTLLLEGMLKNMPL